MNLPASAGPHAMAPGRLPFHVLAKPAGAACNLDCAYCFFLPKQDLYPGSSFRMDDDLLEIYLGQLIEAEPSSTVTVAWQGGEPTLMGVDFYRRAAKIAERLLPRGMSVRWTMQTNGTRIDDEWCELFKDHDYLVGLSLDGPRAFHDRYRTDKAGGPTFDRVMAAAGMLTTNGIDTNILTCVSAANAQHGLEVYRFLRDEVGARFIQFIPVVERIGPDGRTGSQVGDEVTDRSVRAGQWGGFLIEVFDEWLRTDVGEVFVLMFEWALSAWLGLPSPACIFRPTCGDAVALEHNGDVYSCDHYVEPRYRLGNIRWAPLAGLVSGDVQQAFGRQKRRSLPRTCRECAVRFACHGECPKNRFVSSPEGETGLNYLCAGYLSFFTHIDQPMRAMAGLVQRGAPAADIIASPDPPEAGPS